MISDDKVRHTKMIDDVKEELDRLFRVNVGDGLCFYPLGKFVHCYE